MREGVPMRALLCLMGIATAAVSAGFTDQQIEDARIWAHESNEAFGVCLQAEVQNKLHSRMAREDFALFIKGSMRPGNKGLPRVVGGLPHHETAGPRRGNRSCDGRVSHSAMARCGDPTLRRERRQFGDAG